MMRVEAPKKIVATPKHEEMILDESLYELQVEDIRFEGKKRERKGVLTSMNRFFKSDQGKTLRGFLLGGAIVGSTSSGIESFFPQSVRRDAYTFEESASDDSFAGDRPLDEVRSELTEMIGVAAVRELVPVAATDRDRSSRERRREDLRREDISTVEGFDSVGVSEALVTRYLEEGFPRFMTARSAVSSIEFTTEHRLMRADYHMEEGTEIAGTCSIGEASEASEIRLYGSLLDTRGRLEISSAFGEVLVHELAHAIDWENLDALDPATRLRMLHQMVGHARDEERLRFSYIEQIHSDNPQEQLRNRAVEYYAELTSNVFRLAPDMSADDPFWAQDLSNRLIEQYGSTEYADTSIVSEDATIYRQHVIDDIELVREIVAAYDPDFDWQAASHARREVIAEMRRDLPAREIKALVREVKNETARALLQERIDELFDSSESDVTRFIRLSGSDFSETRESHDTEEISNEVFHVGRALEIDISGRQRDTILTIEAEIRSEEMPAYRALIALLENLADYQNNPEVVEDMQYWVNSYREAAAQAGSGHVESARRYMDVLEGREGISADLLTRVRRFVNTQIPDDGG